jgi:hypothetical protein
MKTDAHLSFWEPSNFVPAGRKGRPNLAQGNALGKTLQSGQALQGRIKSGRFEPPLQGWSRCWGACPRRRSRTRSALGCLKPPRWGCQIGKCARDANGRGFLGKTPCTRSVIPFLFATSSDLRASAFICGSPCLRLNTGCRRFRPARVWSRPGAAARNRAAAPSIHPRSWPI